MFATIYWMENFKIHVAGGERHVVKISGEINENSDLELARVPPNKPVEIDLSEVTFINSEGIRNFKVWCGAIKAPVIELSFCPKVFVDQLNMIHGLVPERARVISFYLPFHSAYTGEEKTLLLVRGQHYTLDCGELTLNILPVQDQAGKPMVMDVLAAKYFSFLKTYG